MSCNCLEIVYGPRPSVEFLCPVRKIEFFPISKGVPGPEGPDGPEGPPNTNASLLSTGTVPLGRLAGITNAQLSATAGILSDQIAGLDAAKLTGTLDVARLPIVPTNKGGFGLDVSASAGYLKFTAGVPAFSAGIPGADITSGTLPVARLNGGTTAQFARGDGTFANALTGGLTIAGALAGATTGSFSGAVATGALTVTGAMAASGAVSGTTGTFSGALTIGSPITFPAAGGYIQSNSSAGFDTGDLVLFGGGGGTSSRSGVVRIFGKDSATAPGHVWIYPCSAGVGEVRIFDNALTIRARFTTTGLAVTGGISATTFGAINSTSTIIGTAITASGVVSAVGIINTSNLLMNSGGNVVLSSSGKIIYGAAGTTTAANNETVGTSTGPVTNAPSGSTVRTTIAGTTVLTVGASLLTVAGNIQFSATPSRVCGPAGNAGQIVFAGGSGADWTTGGIFRAWGNSSAQTGNVQMIPGNAAGALAEIYDRALVRQAFADANGFNINKIILTANTPATATSTGTAGQIAWDSSGNIYICSATNTWRRVATSTF